MKAILTFHSLDDSGSVLSFSPLRFRKMVEQLLESGVSIVPLDHLLRQETQNAIAITFDDGMRSVFQHALPVLREHQVPSHLYLTTGSVGSTNHWPTQPANAPIFDMMNWAEVEACFEASMSIECHTVSHPNLRQLSRSKIVDEFEAANQSIETHLGYRPKHFAYPYGFYNRAVQQLTEQFFSTSVTTKLKALGHNDNLLELPRLDSYYLQYMPDFGQLFSRRNTTYIKLRSLLRDIKSSVTRQTI